MDTEANFEDALRSLRSSAIDAAAVMVGLGVLGVNRLQVIRRELCHLYKESHAHDATAPSSPTQTETNTTYTQGGCSHSPQNTDEGHPRGDE